MSANRAREIFVHLVSDVPPEQWDEKLADLASDDPALRAKVANLLAASRQADSFLEQPAPLLGRTVEDVPVSLAPALTREHANTEHAGVMLAGRYKLLEQIGEGGMGAVWMAQQTAPVKRVVAVKLIKSGMDSRAVLARFEAERQALALMDHPNIAKVFDAGTTPDGRPFFVMELVKGVPITRFCDERHLTPRERLQLFIPLCHAIQHAHQKSVIHRDIKPSNVLVALYDDRPVPKVIDFGVAKATGQQLSEHTLNTGFGVVVGTFEYMSPEQASFNQLDIDTRSDIYALGILLYELLAGSPPFSRKMLEQAGMLELLRLIREQEPSKPSTKLSTADGLPALAANRGTDPAKLTKIVRGELDWIVMKALEKERSRRYETANGFAQDVQRYLNNEPVLAGPPSAAYRLRKFVQRNRGKVLAASVIVLILIGGIIGTSLGLIHATSAQAEAVSESNAKDRAIDARNVALLEKQGALTRVSQNERQAKIDFSTFLLDRGLAACDKGDIPFGLLLFARSLEVAPPDAADLHRVLRINLAAWSQQTSRLRWILPQDDYYSDVERFSPDGKTLLTVSRPNKAQLWDATTGDPIGQPLLLTEIPQGQSFEFGYVKSTGFSADGKMAWVVDLEHLRRLDVGTGRPVGVPRPGFRAISPDGRVFVTDGKISKTIQLWDAAADKPIGQPLPDSGLLAFSPDSKFLVTGGDKQARFLDSATGQPLGQPLDVPEGFRGALFSPDSKTYVTGGGKQARLWSVPTGQPIGPPLEHAKSLTILGFSHDGKSLATVDNPAERPELRQWDVATGKLQGAGSHGVDWLVRDGKFALKPRYYDGNPSWARLFEPHRGLPGKPPPPRATQLVAMKPAATTALVQADDRSAQLWNADTGECLGAPLPYPHADHYPIFAPGAQSYLTRDSLRRTAHRFWEVGPANPRGQIVPVTSPSRDVQFSAHAQFLLSGYSGSARGRRAIPSGLRLSDRAGNILGEVQGEEQRITLLSAVFSPDHRMVLTRVNGGGSIGGSNLWEVEKGNLISRWKSRTTSVALGPDGKTFLTGNPDGTAQLREVPTGKILCSLTHRGAISALAFSPNGQTLLTGCGDPTSPDNRGGEVQLWDAATGQRKGEPWPHQGAVLAACFSPDGQTVLTGSLDGAARLWNVATGKPIGSPLAHRAKVTALAFSADGKTALTGSVDGTARLCDAATGKPLGAPLLHDFEVTYVGFDQQDNTALTAGRQGQLQRWQMPTPLEGSVHSVALWAEVFTGMELDAGGVVGKLNRDAWRERR